MDEHDLKKLEAAGSELSFGAGQMLIERGKPGTGLYVVLEGHIVVDSITPMTIRGITRELAQESGFDSVKDLLSVAKHGKGNKVYLIRFHYLQPGGWEGPAPSGVDWVERAWRRKAR